MNLLFQKSIQISKEIGQDQWKDPIYGEVINIDHVDFEQKLVFETINGKRVVIKNAILTIYQVEIAIDQSFINACVIDEEHQIYYVSQVDSIKNESGETVKYLLNLTERRS